MNNCIFSCLLLVASLSSCRQITGPPMPAFNLQLVDSTTLLSSKDIPDGRPIVLIYFSPDCEHCQHETENILGKMDSLQDVRFYFITTDPFDRLRVFHEYYHISEYPNVVLSKDIFFSFFNRLKPIGTPNTFIYDRHKTLKAVLSGETQAGTIIYFIKTI